MGEEDSLKFLLEKCKKKSHEAKDKVEQLEYVVKYVKRTATSAIQQITKQMEQIKEELEIACSKEIESINRPRT